MSRASKIGLRALVYRPNWPTQAKKYNFYESCTFPDAIKFSQKFGNFLWKFKYSAFLGVRFLNIGAYTFKSENRILKRLMAILIEFVSGSHAESHYSWLFMKISQWNGIIIKNNIKWYLDQIQIITCHIQSPSQPPQIIQFSIKNAHFTGKLSFDWPLGLK